MTRLVFFRITTTVFGFLCLLLTVGGVGSGLVNGGPGGHFHGLLLSHGAQCGAFLATGFLSPLRRAEARIASWQMLLVTVVCMEGVGLALGIDDPLFEIGFPVALVLTGLLHPARARLLRPGPEVSRVLLVVAALSAVPALLFTVHLGQQLDGLRGDALLAAQAGLDVTFTVPFVGLVAAVRAPGWRLVAWSTSTVAVVLGGASIAYPRELGSVGAHWGAGIALAGILFVALAEWTTARGTARAGRPIRVDQVA